MPETLFFDPADAKSGKGQLYVTCDCKRRVLLGSWGAAHLGNTAFSNKCPCGRTIQFCRVDPRD